MSSDRGLVSELKRRRVIRVAIAYVAVGLGVIYAADAIFENLPVPEWAATLIIVVVGLGFPIAVALAWAFDITPAGIERTAAGAGPAAEADATATAEADPAGPDHDPVADRSIAVLPFDNMSEDPEQEYLSDGIAEDLTTALSQFGWLFVVARNSAFTYKGQPVDVKTVGKELGVRYVVEGSVRRAGDRIRVNVQLIDARTDRNAWAEQFDREHAPTPNWGERRRRSAGWTLCSSSSPGIRYGPSRRTRCSSTRISSNGWSTA